MVHDLLWAPLILLGGVVVSRLVPARIRAATQAVLFVVGCAALVAWPEVRDYARVLHNPTSLPRNYAASLAVVAASVMALTLVGAAAWAARRGPGRRPTVPVDPVDSATLAGSAGERRARLEE